MPWQPGQSGNPNGRPLRGRSLAELLQKELEARYLDRGQMIPRQEIMARLLIDATTTGRVDFPEDAKGIRRTLLLNAEQWLDTIRLVLGHVDGPPVSAAGALLETELDMMLDQVMRPYAHALPAPVGPGPLTE